MTARKYICTVELRGGGTAERIVDADSAEAARGQVEEGGDCFLLSCRETGSARRGGFRRKGASTEELIAFFRQWEVLLRAGMPVSNALRAILDQRWSGSLDRILRSALSDIEGGKSISDALAAYPAEFPRFLTASVSAAEKTGTVPETLRRHVEYLSRMRELRRAVTAAAVYPLVLLVTLVVVSVFLLLYVVPSFAQIYADSKAQLPWITVAFLGLSAWIRMYWFLWVLGIVAAAVAARAVWASALREPLERSLLRLPRIGDLLMDHLVVRFARTLSTLLRGGFPLLDSLRISTDVTGNLHMARRMEKVAAEVEGGSSLGDALRRDGTMPPVAVRMVEAGERGGELAGMLEELAAYSEETLKHRLRVAVSLFEPAMMVLVGAVVALLVIAIYLPIFRISGVMG
jgi:type IV pilus assembly protein PilC